MAFMFYQFSLVKDIPSVIKIEKDGLTVRQLLDYLEETYHSTLKELVVTEDGEPKDDVIVSVNGTPVRYLNGLETVIQKDNEVTFSMLLAGG